MKTKYSMFAIAICFMLPTLLACGFKGNNNNAVGNEGYYGEAAKMANDKPNILKRIKLVEYKTGYYEYKDVNALQVLYQPMIIMKWKNISNAPIEESVEVKGVFISKGEEWGTDFSYLQSSSDAPLQPSIIRQCYINSNVGYTSVYSIYDSDISCQIYINDQLYQTFKIKNQHLTSNRISSYTVPDRNNDSKNNVTPVIKRPTIRGELQDSYELNVRLMTKADVQDLNAAELRILRNEIYARHGYKFKSSDLQRHFSAKPWYKSQYDDVSYMLNRIEKQNVQLISEFEKMSKE
jgi:hypothetical protein